MLCINRITLQALCVVIPSSLVTERTRRDHGDADPYLDKKSSETFPIGLLGIRLLIVDRL